jgi:hypothetical protein
MEKYNKTCTNVEQNLFGILAASGSDGGSDDPQPVASEFTGIGGGTPLLADEIIDGGSRGGGDDASPERRTSRGLVVRNGGKGLAFSDGIIDGFGDGFGDLLPSGLISDSGDGAIFSGVRNKSVSNASGNLLVPDSGTDPFAAPLATLL